MINKNHDIQLKDTSEAEMARFRQIMLGIWRQQIEEDKNAKLMGNSLNGSLLNNTNLISIKKIAQSIKKHLGQNHKSMLFNTLIEEEPYLFNIPINAENLTYNDSQGNQKSGVILLKWISFTGINLIPKTFQASIEIGHEHTDFSLTIFQNDLKEIAFKFIVHDFDLFMALFVELGIKYTDIANQAIIDLYLKKIKEANDDPDKLDVIYQSFPKIMFGKMDDTELYKHLDLILKSMYQFGGSTGTNEDKAILQILYAINDRQTLYTILRDSDNGLLFNIYKKLQGEEAQDLLRFLTRLTEEFDKSKPDDVVYFDNSYYLFRDTHLKTNWADGNILLDNYKDATKITLTKEHKNPMEIYAPEYYIKNKSFNPLTKLNFGTKLGDFGEQVGDENTFVLALKLHNMATKQSNWDLFNIATDLLSLISGGAALRLVLAKGAPIAARALAGLTLAKDAAHYAMLSDGTLEKWHANGFGWLANLWIAFSVTVDLASFGLPNVSKIAREGNAAAELAETVEEAREIRKVSYEANKIVEAKTGKHVSKMTKNQFERFIKKAEKKQKTDPEQYGEFIDTPENITRVKIIDQTKFTETPFGESKMSKLAIEHRKSLAIPKHGGNVAVFEFIDSSGLTQYKAISTEIEVRTHAEILGMKWLTDNKIPYTNVKKIYSELEPCSLGQSACKKVLKENFPNIEIEYSYQYKGTGRVSEDIPEVTASRKHSIEQRNKDLNKLIKDK